MWGNKKGQKAGPKTDSKKKVTNKSWKRARAKKQDQKRSPEILKTRQDYNKNIAALARYMKIDRTTTTLTVPWPVGFATGKNGGNKSKGGQKAQKSTKKILKGRWTIDDHSLNVEVLFFSNFHLNEVIIQTSNKWKVGFATVSKVLQVSKQCPLQQGQGGGGLLQQEHGVYWESKTERSYALCLSTDCSDWIVNNINLL